MATTEQIQDLVIKEAKTLEVHSDLTDLMGQAVIVYDRETGLPTAFDADVLSGRTRVVVGTQEEIDSTPKRAGVFYCTFED